jgi:hypothetical protein
LSLPKSTAILMGSGAAAETQACAEVFRLCIEGKPVTQLAAIVKKYLQDNPQLWDNGFSMIIYNAVFARCVVADMNAK